MSTIRPCREDELPTVLSIINESAQVYRGAIPADRWHDPYMSMEELQAGIGEGIRFSAYEHEGRILGVMGIQPVQDVNLIRHAYVRPGEQRRGVGAALMDHLRARETRQTLVGTWADATWAIRFYERNGFALVSRPFADELLEKYWKVPAAQIEASVVLANPPLSERNGVTAPAAPLPVTPERP